jgi:hypothetical protein
MILRPKSLNHSCRFWGQNQETRATGFEAKPRETVTTGYKVKLEKTVATSFEGKSKKTVLVVLRPNHWQTMFWGSNKKPTLLVSTCTVQTTHDITRPLNCPATEYLTCETISDPLQQVSYFWQDLRHFPPCRTCHLHTTRQANTILQTK